MADLIGFSTDAEARKAIAAALKVMPDMEHLVLRYLGMFRPATRALTMSRTVALLQQIANDMEAGRIERSGRKWPAPRTNWKLAMEQMIESRDKIRLPLKGHGYLYEILAGMANREEGQAESKLEQERKDGQHRRKPVAEENPVVQKAVQKTRKKESKRTDPKKAGELIGGLKDVLKGG